MREATKRGNPNLHKGMFQSTPPMREATFVANASPRVYFLFQSTPPMREATPYTEYEDRVYFVSIHASHAGGDQIFLVSRN